MESEKLLPDQKNQTQLGSSCFDASPESARSFSLQSLDRHLVLRMHDCMVKSRVLEERLIQIYKNGEAYFWIGGPGEEAFGVALGLLVHKGKGPEYDWMHLHYRCTSTLIAMGMPMVDGIRLIMNRSTDRCTGGRNFSNHYSFPEWNVAPVTSPIEVQYIIALGTAHVQKRTKSKGITIVSGGDAGTAEGDFASSLVWSSRKGQELPMLLTVQNNRWGISTAFEGQHGETHIAERGRAFGIRTAVINGNDPIECYIRLKEEMEYIRQTGRPVLLEAEVSRLYGHSSASGANKQSDFDCLIEFEKKLVENKYLDEEQIKNIWSSYQKEAKALQEQVRKEPLPLSNSIWDHTFVNQENANWRNF